MTTVPDTETEARAASNETVRVVYMGLFEFVIVMQTVARVDGTWLHSWSTVTGDQWHPKLRIPTPALDASKVMKSISTSSLRYLFVGLGIPLLCFGWPGPRAPQQPSRWKTKH